MHSLYQHAKKWLSGYGYIQAAASIAIALGGGTLIGRILQIYANISGMWLISLDFLLAGIFLASFEWQRRRDETAKPAVKSSDVSAQEQDFSLSTTRPLLKILGPLQNSSVSLKQIVCGSVDPPRHPVRAIIRVKDGRCFLQDVPTYYNEDGTIWNIECQFGNLTGGAGGHYEIIAVDGTKPIESVSQTLPDMPKSQSVAVTRKKDEAISETQIRTDAQMELARIYSDKLDPYHIPFHSDHKQRVDHVERLNRIIYPEIK